MAHLCLTPKAASIAPASFPPSRFVAFSLLFFLLLVFFSPMCSLAIAADAESCSLPVSCAGSMASFRRQLVAPYVLALFPRLVPSASLSLSSLIVGLELGQSELFRPFARTPSFLCLPCPSLLAAAAGAASARAQPARPNRRNNNGELQSTLNV